MWDRLEVGDQDDLLPLSLIKKSYVYFLFVFERLKILHVAPEKDFNVIMNLLGGETDLNRVSSHVR